MLLRLYSIPGCPHCEAAKAYLAARKVDYEEITNLQDPIMKAGFAVIFPGRPPEFPILVDSEGETALIGFKEGDYEIAVNTYLSSSLPNGSPIKQQPSGETPELAEVETPKA